MIARIIALLEDEMTMCQAGALGPKKLAIQGWCLKEIPIVSALLFL